MAFQLPNLPNFNVNTPQMPDALQQYGKMLQLKALSGSLAMQPLQQEAAQQDVQAKGLQNQKEQMALDSQKKLMDAISSGAFNKYAGVETADGTGFDAGKAYQDLVANHGVLPDQASAAVSSILNIAKNQAEISKTQGQAGEAQQNIRAKTLEQVAAKLGSIEDAAKKDLGDGGKALDAFKQDLVRNPKAYAGLTQQELGELYGSSLEHIPAMTQLLGVEGKIADFHKSKAEAASAGQKVINPETGMSPEQEGEARKTVAVETNPAVIQAKATEAGAEGAARAKAEIAAAGALKPGYAYDPKTGRTVLTDESAYLGSKGQLQGFRPVTEKEMDEDRQLNNRLADVAQKMQRYRETLQKSLSADDMAKMSAVIDPHNKLHIGISHTEIPIDSFNQLFQSSLMNKLSPDAQKRLIAFRNAQEAMTGYTRVLTGSGRSSDTSLALNEAALPHPLNSPEYSNEALNQFGENLKVAAQGLPTLPGVKSPDEVVKSMSSGSGPAKGDVKNYQGHDYKFDGDKWVRQ